MDAINLSSLIAYLLQFLVVFTIWELLKRKLVTSPRKPLLTCLLDAVMRIPSLLGLGPYGRPNDINEAVVQAIKETGLSDFNIPKKKGSKTEDNGSSGFIERYSAARQLGLERSGCRYSPSGYVLALSTLKKRVEIRLRMVEYIKRNPAVLDVKFESPPIFAVGFPRTGTTFLHELLGLHPKVQMHYTWEQMAPVPSTTDARPEAMEIDRKKRYAANKSRMDFFLRLAGDSIQSIHRVGYDEAEECTTPLASDLPWSIPEIGFITYASEELAKLGGGNAFSNYREYLQLLQYQRPQGDKFTWMLKCPFHLPYLSELYEAFPGSTVVWTHRDPTECIASACSLYETLLQFTMETHTVDKKALGLAVLEYTKQSLAKAFETLDRLNGKVSIQHVKYSQTVKTPKEAVRRIYEAAGLGYSEEYDAKLDAYIQKNADERKAKKASKQGVMHQYSLEDYGLSTDVVKAEFKQYIEKYCK